MTRLALIYGSVEAGARLVMMAWARMNPAPPPPAARVELFRWLSQINDAPTTQAYVD
jgi:hypothetical protein